MIHNTAARLTAMFIRKEWIGEELAPSCCYELETHLGRFLFFALLITISLALHKCAEALIFSVTLFLFRRRMGGWHAPSVWVCQTISVCIMLFVVLVGGPFLIRLGAFGISVSNVGIIATSFVIPPAIPHQMHLSDAEIAASIRKKNQLLLFLIVVQPLIYLSWGIDDIAYTTLGLSFGIISIIHEKIKQKIALKG